jgi:outer membrane protein
MKLLRFALLSSVLFAALTWSAQAQQKIGIIDLRKVFDNYYKTKIADAGLKEEAGELDAQKKEMVESFRKQEEEWKKLLDRANDQALSSDQRDRSKKEAEQKLVSLKEMEQTITGFERSARARLSEKQRRKRDQVLVEIREVIDARAKAAGYSLVLDTAAESIANTPIVIFSSGENDLTEIVLNKLNETAPAGFSKSEDPRKR